MKRTGVILFVLFLLLAAALPAAARAPRLADEADLLSDSEEAAVLSTLDSLSEALQFDIVVVTVPSLDGWSEVTVADDYYDDNDYGYGEDKDGVLLLAVEDEEIYYVSTCGYGITAVSDAGLELISRRFRAALEDGYKEAFVEYAAVCEELVTAARAGDVYDESDLPKEPFATGKFLLIALAVGFIAALLIVTSMKRKLKSVRFKATAADYTRAGSLQISESHDLFLYRQVSRRPRPKNNSGSGTHRASSGRSHGGGRI